MKLELLTLIVLGELLIVGWLLAIGLTLARLWSGSRARRAALRLVERVSAQRAARNEELKALLIDRAGSSEAEASARAGELGRLETAFYQAFLDIYLARDNAAIAGINVPFEAVVDAYRGLVSGGGNVGDGERQESLMSDEEIGRMQAEMAALREKNEQLAKELGISMDTMGQMLDEYSNMAENNDGSDVDRGKILSMFQEEEDDDIAVSEEELIEKEDVAEVASSAMEEISEPPGEAVDEVSSDPSDSDPSGSDAGEASVGEPVGESISELSLDELEITIPAETDVVSAEAGKERGSVPPDEPIVDKIKELQLDGDLGPEKSSEGLPESEEAAVNG